VSGKGSYPPIPLRRPSAAGRRAHPRARAPSDKGGRRGGDLPPARGVPVRARGGPDCPGHPDRQSLSGPLSLLLCGRPATREPRVPIRPHGAYQHLLRRRRRQDDDGPVFGSGAVSPPMAPFLLPLPRRPRPRLPPRPLAPRGQGEDRGLHVRPPSLSSTAAEAYGSRAKTADGEGDGLRRHVGTGRSVAVARYPL
jgi:hypothetical protein